MASWPEHPWASQTATCPGAAVPHCRSAKAAHLCRVCQNNCLIDDGSREMRSSVGKYITSSGSLATRMLRRRLPVRTSSVACSFCTTANRHFRVRGQRGEPHSIHRSVVCLTMTKEGRCHFSMGGGAASRHGCTLGHVVYSGQKCPF